jgi:hypothetical protein
MPCAARPLLLVLVLLIGLGACAPVMLGRTPYPAPVGQTESSLALGFPLSLTSITVCDGPTPEPDCPMGVLGPTYLPIAVPGHLTVARGVEDGGEFNYTFLLAANPGVRFGGKNLLQEAPVALAVDYGASLLLANAGLDIGLLAGLPFEGGELYGGVRGFGTLPWAGFAPGLSAALTLGTQAPASGRTNAFFELTLSAAFSNTYGLEGIQPVGFSLVPAFGLMF